MIISNHLRLYFANYYRSMLFSNGAVMPSLDVRLSVCLSVRDVGEQ